MRQVTINIPEGKFKFIMELLQSFNYIKIDAPADKFIISEEQKAMLNEEFRKIEEDPKYLLDWDEVKHQLNIS